jgi:heme/copper-type cytochrome/quinol oxidase subunit 2
VQVLVNFLTYCNHVCLDIASLSGTSDAPVSWQVFFQQPASPIMEGLVEFHNDLMLLIVFVLFFVGGMLFATVWSFSGQPRVTFFDTQNTSLEIAWTLIPAGALLFILGPSLALLYAMDEVTDPSISVKIIGHQWYWVYEYGEM